MKDLREFLDRVEELGELKVIEGANWDLEIGAITEWQSQPNTPLLLFDKIKDYQPGYRIVSNFAASPRRVALLLGFPGVEKPMELVKALREKMKGGMRPVPPVAVKTGPVKENVDLGDDVDLFRFPTPRWHELDGGRYIGTGNMVIMRDPDTGWVNVGTYRVEIQDKNTVSIYIIQGQHGDLIRRKYWAKGKSCPVAISCGQDLQLWLISTHRIPLGVGEYDYAGWLMDRPVEVIRGETTDLPIPATAEIVLEGEMLPPEIETRIEGPFGEWSGYYAGGQRAEPVVKVKSVLYRNDPIMLGVPMFRFMPLYWMGKNILTAAEVHGEIERQVPGVKGLWVVEEAAGCQMVVASIEQLYTGHAKRVATTLMSTGLVSSMVRFLIVVDEDIDPSNISEVLWAVATRCDPVEHIDIIRNWWGQRLDPILSPEKRARGEFGKSVAIITACKPYHWMKDFPPAIKTNPEFMERTMQKWRKILQ